MPQHKRETFYFAGQHYQTLLREERTQQAALALPPPTPVDLGRFSRADDIPEAKEVNVVGWANYAYNYQLQQKRNGITTSEYYMMVLFGAADGADSKLARAALIMSPEQHAWFLEHQQEFIDVAASSGADFGQSSSAASSLVSGAFRDEGLKQSDDFIYLVYRGMRRAKSALGRGFSRRKSEPDPFDRLYQQLHPGA